MRQKAEKYADVHRAVSCADKPWSERKQSTPGYMTVYLALVMGILLSLILAVLTAVRISTIRMYIECCADMALDSALAEYHREMLDQYDLFFIDTAYQTGDPSYHRTEEHIFRYMERNLRPQEEFPTAGAKDLLGLSTEDVELLQAGVATCLLYTSDAADEEDSVGLGGSRIIKKKDNKKKIQKQRILI